MTCQHSRDRATLELRSWLDFPQSTHCDHPLPARPASPQTTSHGCTSLSHPSQCDQSLAWDPGLLGPWSLIQRAKIKAHTNCTSHKQTKAISRTGQKIHCKIASSRPRENVKLGSNCCLGLPYIWLKRRRNLVNY